MVCDETPAPADLCVRGEQGPSGEQLVPDRPVRFELRPAGCYSSSCTQVVDASCSVMRAGPELAVSTNFCLDIESDPTVPCNDDCGGGGLAACSSEALPAGGYSVTAGAFTVLFTLPMSLPAGGLCADVDF